jgi:hypothetical protein
VLLKTFVSLLCMLLKTIFVNIVKNVLHGRHTLFCYYWLFYLKCGLFRDSTMAECSLVRLSAAICMAEPIVLRFSARLCKTSQNCVPDIVSEACSWSCYSCCEVMSLQ